MTMPSTKRVMNGRTKSSNLGSYWYIAHSTSTETLLQHFTQITGQDIGFNKGIPEISDTHRAVHRIDLSQCFIKMAHATSGRIYIFLNTNHAVLAGIHKGRLHGRRQDKGIGVHRFHHLFFDTYIGKQIYLSQRLVSERERRQEMQGKQTCYYQKGKQESV